MNSDDDIEGFDVQWRVSFLNTGGDRITWSRCVDQKDAERYLRTVRDEGKWRDPRVETRRVEYSAWLEVGR